MNIACTDCHREFEDDQLIRYQTKTRNQHNTNLFNYKMEYICTPCYDERFGHASE